MPATAQTRRTPEQHADWCVDRAALLSDEINRRTSCGKITIQLTFDGHDGYGSILGAKFPIDWDESSVLNTVSAELAGSGSNSWYCEAAEVIGLGRWLIQQADVTDIDDADEVWRQLETEPWKWTAEFVAYRCDVA